jgi:hypothetical protein
MSATGYGIPGTPGGGAPVNSFTGQPVASPATKPKQNSAEASPYYYQYGFNSAPGGLPSYAEQKANEAYGYSGLQKTRTAPQADLTGANTDLGSARNSLNDARVVGLGGVARLGQAYDIGQQQQGLANQYQGVISGTAGPSLAELAMQRASDAEARRNISMAAGVGGPGSIAATINAQNRNAVAQGELQQNLGIQRAAEVEAARQGLGGVLGNIRGQTAAEASAYGGLGGLEQGIGQGYGTIGQIGGAQALSNAGLQAQQNMLNQQGEQYYYGQGANWTQGQAALNEQLAANHNNYAIGATSLANQAAAANNARGDQWLGAGLSALGTLGAAALTAGTGGAAAPLLVASGSGTAAGIAKAAASSDIRAKTAIAPAGPQIANAFRGVARANEQAGRIANTEVQYPDVSSSSYLYRNPNAPGAEPGRHYGPMAQELEQTPAGASVVRTMPDGSKGIDTGRLSLLNASQTGELTRRLDRLEQKQVPRVSEQERSNAEKKAKNDRLAATIAGIGADAAQRLGRPTAYPYTAPVALPQYQPAPQPIAAQPAYYSY